MPVASLSMLVRRGERSSNFIWTFLGVLVTVEVAIIALLNDLTWWGRIALTVAVVALTFQFIRTSGWAQNKIVGLLVAMETTWRNPTRF